MYSNSYPQARGELASPFAQAVKQENDQRSLQQHWHGEESGLVEQIESMCQQARTYEGQVRAEAQRYTREVANETNTARTNLQRVEEQASRDLALANAQQLAAEAEVLRESGIATSLSSQPVQLRQQLIVL